jgi:hypothetical protein
LEENKDGIESTEVRDFTIHAREEVSESLTKSDDETEELLGGLEEFTILFG